MHQEQIYASIDTGTRILALLCFISAGSDSCDALRMLLFHKVAVQSGNRAHVSKVRWVPSISGNLSIFQSICPYQTIEFPQVEWCLLSVIYCNLLQVCLRTVCFVNRFLVRRSLCSYGEKRWILVFLIHKSVFRLEPFDFSFFRQGGEPLQCVLVIHIARSGSYWGDYRWLNLFELYLCVSTVRTRTL